MGAGALALGPSSAFLVEKQGHNLASIWDADFPGRGFLLYSTTMALFLSHAFFICGCLTPRTESDSVFKVICLFEFTQGLKICF